MNSKKILELKFQFGYDDKIEMSLYLFGSFFGNKQGTKANFKEHLGDIQLSLGYNFYDEEKR